ncbi:MAG: serine protease [Thermomicrobia bacterium]|nr:serine protease [Thermomicrobia bacterium]
MKIETPAQAALFSTVRIETDKGTGTGFLFRQNIGHSYSPPFIVTNRHVFEDAAKVNFFFTKRAGDGNERRALIGQRVDISLSDFADRWHGHPDPEIDVAILPFFPFVPDLSEQHARIFITVFGDENLVTEDTLDSFDVLEEILFIGYPNGMYDERNLLPVMRRGTTATPIHFNYNGKPSFLIDASVFPGSSGSPVLIVNHGEWVSKGKWMSGSRIILLGIISEVFVREEFGEVHPISIPTTKKSVAVINQMIDIGIVFKTSTITETIADYVGSAKFERDVVSATNDPRYLASLGDEGM